MSDDKPFLITPPPGMLPERRRDDDQDDAPVQTGSGTRRLELDRRPPVVGVPLPDASVAAAPAPVAHPVAAPVAEPPAAEATIVDVPAAPAAEPLTSTITRTSPAEPVQQVDDSTVLRSDVVAVESTPDDTVLVSTNLQRRWVVEFSDGTRVTIAPGGLIVGRDPAAFARWPEAELVHLDDPGRSVSKTHAVIQPDADGVRVIDLGSTNGVNRIVDDLRVPVDGEQGELVRDGAVLEFGSLVGVIRHV